ncbi:hypothetical protein CH274_08050 [Rhodococcus sp. 06-418-5]|nr:hypothetical protein CH274_08050 [Rhodococcus sp. 06-418-5]
MSSPMEQISAASRIEDPNESIRELKRIAADTLSTADGRARIVMTSNFNHTYLPDFVVEWPERSANKNRPVFLRASALASELEDDVNALKDREPIFLHLSSLLADYSAQDVAVAEDPVQNDSGAIDVDSSSLDSAAFSSHALVTSLQAISNFSTVDATATGRLFSSYVIRGGQGLLEADEAANAAVLVNDGFSGALDADASRTAAALETVQDILNAPTASQFTHLLEAAWVSSGASALEFPGGVSSLGDKITSELMRELMDIVPVDVSDFWKRLGNAVDLGTFSGLNLVGDQPKLQLLVPAALPKLAARACAIRVTHRIDQKIDPFLWQVEDGLLSLRGAGHQAWLMDKASTSPAGEGLSVTPPPTISRLSNRSVNADIQLVQVDAADSNNTVSVASNDSRSIASSKALSRIESSLEKSAVVSRAVALVGGTKPLKLSFETGSAAGNTNTRFDAAGLVWNAWSLLADSDEDTQASLRKNLFPSETEAIGPDQSKPKPEPKPGV